MADMIVTKSVIDIWRNRLVLIASSTHPAKTFRISPNGRYVVRIGEKEFDGNNEAAMIKIYNEGNN